MNLPDTLMDCYHAVEKRSRQMLSAARASDWDRLRGEEVACAALIDGLRAKAIAQSLSKEEQLEKGRIMHRILRLDAQIRYLIEPWRTHYEHRFEGNPHRSMAPSHQGGTGAPSQAK